MKLLLQSLENESALQELNISGILMRLYFIEYPQFDSELLKVLASSLKSNNCLKEFIAESKNFQCSHFYRLMYK